MKAKEFREHRPAYFSGFENHVYSVDTFSEVLEIPFVKTFSKSKGFYSYAVAVDTKPEYRLTLMALCNWDDEYNGCTSWWVCGYLTGFSKSDTGLKNYEDLRSNHKPNCWQNKYHGCKHLLGYDRPKESQMKTLKELGWHKDDTTGVAVYCDCGYKH